MTTLHRLPTLLFALALGAPALAQFDIASLQQRATATSAEVQTALATCNKALAAVRAAIGDPENKVQGDCTEIGNVLQGGTFDAAIGVVPIALDHLGFVAEDNQAATRQALAALLAELQKGSRLLQATEALHELAGRCEHLATLGAEDDATASLVDLAASAQKATLAHALPTAELATLQQHLAKRRAAEAARLGALLREQANTELTQLKADFASMRTEMASQDSGERDRGFARFDEAARSIATALARVPAADRKKPVDDLATMRRQADELHGKAFAAATAQRLKDNWLFTADQFDGWTDEAVTAVAPQGYVDFDPAGTETLCLPKTAALVARANLWFAFAGQDPDFVRGMRAAEVAAFTKSIVEQQAAAHATVLPVAKALVDGFAGLAIVDERVRGRLQTFADWELPLLLQNHADQHELVDRVHDLLDAHDRQALGDEKALATIREQALVAADALWPRYQQWLPLEGGFDPAQAGLFTDRLMRLEGVVARSGEFAPAGDLVFDLGGTVFVASFTKDLRAALQKARTRLQLPSPERIGSDQPCELMAIVEGEVTASLLGKKGLEDAIPVPARAITVIGLRQGAVFAVRP